MRVIFMGTPDFAVGTLEAIVEAGYEVVLVVTQPDKPKGRSGALQAPPVKECALKHNLEVFQPKKIRLPENVAYLEGYKPDMIVVAAFGQILPKSAISMPMYTVSAAMLGQISIGAKSGIGRCAPMNPFLTRPTVPTRPRKPSCRKNYMPCFAAR